MEASAMMTTAPRSAIPTPEAQLPFGSPLPPVPVGGKATDPSRQQQRQQQLLQKQVLQLRLHNKLKAEDPGSVGDPPALPKPVVVPAPAPTAAVQDSRAPTPTPAAQGSCLQMAISLDESSSDDGDGGGGGNEGDDDENDFPVDANTTPTVPVPVSHEGVGERRQQQQKQLPAADAKTTRMPPNNNSNSNNLSTHPARPQRWAKAIKRGPRVSMSMPMPVAASTASAAAAPAAAAHMNGNRVGGASPSGGAPFAYSAVNGSGGAGAGGVSGRGRAMATAAAGAGGYSSGHHNYGVGVGVKHEVSSGSSGRSAVAPWGATKRRAGRPMGSKKRPNSDDDPAYVAPTTAKRVARPGFVPNIAERPKRQLASRKRWADEMMNPGEQWLRKTPKPAPPLPPNPVDANIPDAPTFYPTPEQFRDPLSYIESIRPIAEGYGIAKIVPPKGWNPPPTPISAHARKLVPTKKQALHSLMNSDEVYDDGRDFTVAGYQHMADRFKAAWVRRERPSPKERAAPVSEPKPPSLETPPGTTTADILGMAKEKSYLHYLEREYWEVVDGGAEEVEVEYANDLDISEFWSGFPKPVDHSFMDGSKFDRNKPCRFDDPDYYRTCGWNLNNLPFWPGSALRFFRTHVNGLTAPWLYLGMQFATFAWHNEDNYLYSLNYHHSGAVKQWYGIPGKHSKGFETCLAKILGETLDTVSEHLYRITKMLSPVYLQRENVPVCRLHQGPGEFVVTFPKAYHGGFSYGFNCGEAVNFGVPDWISYSRESTEAYRSASRMAALSHDKMVATLAIYLPDHDVRGCELLVRELRRIQKEELEHRASLEHQGVQDPSRLGVSLPRFRLGLIERETEEYDERRVCKTCKHTLFMTGVACPCSDVDVSCLRCVGESCDCPVRNKYLLSWWTEDDLTRFVSTAESYLQKLREGRADEAAVAAFRANINPF